MGERKRAEATPGSRERILAAARVVFALHAFGTATTRGIAQAAGVDHPLVHYHFGSKEKLFDAVAAQMGEEFGKAHRSWLQGLDRVSPRAGLSLYIDRLLDHCWEHPEPLQLVLLNMAHTGGPEDVPGYRHVVLHMERTARALKRRIPIRGSRRDVEAFVHCFHTLVVSLIGARACQAEALGLDPEGRGYRAWVENALMQLFLLWLSRLIFPEGRT